MRIIAGRHRGRRILPPRDARTTRPITDRVKQSLFDRLASADRVDSAIVLDVFAGTGSLGLECLSRGASHVTFIEQDRDAAQRLAENLRVLGETDRAQIARADVLSAAWIDSLPHNAYELVFFDPPYAMVADRGIAGRLWNRSESLASRCAADAWLALRLDRHTSAPSLAEWGDPHSFGYGSMTLHLYRRGG